MQKEAEYKSLQQKQSLFDALVPWDTPTSSAMNKLTTEIHGLIDAQTALITNISSVSNPIKALEQDKKYQFTPRFIPRDLEGVAAEISFAQHQINQFAADSDNFFSSDEEKGQAEQIKSNWEAYLTRLLKIQETIFKYQAKDTSKISQQFRLRLDDIKTRSDPLELDKAKRMDQTDQQESLGKGNHPEIDEASDVGFRK